MRDQDCLHPEALPSIHDLTRDELREACARWDEPRYRADQIWRWLYVRYATDWADMRNLPRALRDRLSAHYRIDPGTCTREQVESGGTRKLLIDLNDGEQIEAVIIPAGARTDRARNDKPGSAPRARARRTVCVSTQVGCRFHCSFCASGQAGLHRNLSSGEIAGQVILAARVLGQKPTHVVYMGIGEPFDNYAAVLRSVRVLNDRDGLSIGARRITISTCGLIPGIRRLAGEGLQVELSVSLHAPDDELRSRVMPVNKQHGIADLLDACRDYASRTGRVVTFEYALIGGLNDRPEHAERLASLLAGGMFRVNLIPLSPVAEFAARPAPPAACDGFKRTLQAAGINTTLRASRGASLKAACGQLRLSRAAATNGETPA